MSESAGEARPPTLIRWLLLHRASKGIKPRIEWQLFCGVQLFYPAHGQTRTVANGPFVSLRRTTAAI